MTYEFKTTNIKGKPYVQVNERIKYFWQIYPAPKGKIITKMLSNENGICVFQARIYIDDAIVANGYASENQSGSFINKTSYIENCETSAVGRALGMLGIGIDTSIATAEEVETAINNQTGGKPELQEKSTEELLRSEVLAVVSSKFKTKKEFDDWRAKKGIKTVIKDMTESELSIILDVLEADNANV